MSVEIEVKRCILNHLEGLRLIGKKFEINDDFMRLIISVIDNNDIESDYPNVYIHKFNFVNVEWADSKKRHVVSFDITKPDREMFNIEEILET